MLLNSDLNNFCSVFALYCIQRQWGKHSSAESFPVNPHVILLCCICCYALHYHCLPSVQIAQMGLILPRWGLILPRIPLSSLVLYSAVTRSFRGYVRTQNTPKPTPKHSFSWPELESRQNELQSGQNESNYETHLGNSYEKWAKRF